MRFEQGFGIVPRPARDTPSSQRLPAVFRIFMKQRLELGTVQLPPSVPTDPAEEAIFRTSTVFLLT